MQAGDAMIGKACAACQESFAEGDFTSLIALGPGGDLEARKARDEGRTYNAMAIGLHYECADREPERR